MGEKSFPAESIGDLLFRLFSQGTRWGQVHSVFGKVVNVQFENHLVTVGKGKLNQGPFTLLLPHWVDSFIHLGISPGDLVVVDELQLRIKGRLHIDLTTGVIWESNWHYVEPTVPFSAKLLREMIKLVLENGQLDGLGLLLDSKWNEDATLSVGLRYLLEQGSRAMEKIQQNMIIGGENFWEGAGELIGIGPGLTPAGDDLLGGILLTLNYVVSQFSSSLSRPCFGEGDFLNWLLEKTNPISAQFLHLAYQGRPTRILRDFLYHLFAGQKIQTIQNLLYLLDVGNSSGTDLVTGCLLTIGYLGEEQLIPYA